VKYVVVEWQDDDEFPAYYLDPAPYLKKLPELSDELPAGAREFALDSAHYRFGDPQCVKNLKLVEARFSDGPQPTAVVRLSPNPWMHSQNLIIEYLGVRSFVVEVEPDDEGEEHPQGMDRLLLDEILPHRNGCSHEIRFTGGALNISCGDLRARWEPVPGTDEISQ
jgi:hypothetical protein